jgi:hypothetical protein
MKLPSVLLSVTALVVIGTLSVNLFSEAEGIDENPLAGSSKEQESLIPLAPSIGETTNNTGVGSLSSVNSRTSVDTPPSESEEGSSVKNEGQSSWPSHWLANPAVSALAEHLGIEPSTAVTEIAAVWPELLDQEIQPLGDWSQIEPTFAQTVMDQAVGSIDQWPARVEQKILGLPFESYINNNYESTLSDEDRMSLHADLLACTSNSMLAYSTYCGHLDTAIKEVVANGTYDKFPYLALPGHKVHTETGEGKLAFGGYGAVSGSWVFCLELTQNSYPAVYDSKIEMEKAIKQAKIEAKKTIQKYL